VTFRPPSPAEVVSAQKNARFLLKLWQTADTAEPGLEHDRNDSGRNQYMPHRTARATPPGSSINHTCDPGNEPTVFDPVIRIFQFKTVQGLQRQTLNGQ